MKKKIKKKLEELQSVEGSENWGAIKRLKKDIDFIMEQEDYRWKQRAKHHWYQHGDRNTSFFHAWASHRRKINCIKKICDDEGREWKKVKEIGKSFVNFYQVLFTSGGMNGIDMCLDAMETKVTTKMNAQLVRQFEATEVELALSQTGPLKSSRPDGFATCFYQQSWGQVRDEACNVVLSFLNGGDFDSSINKTFIAFISKVKNPSCIIEYRPISLCNVLYKLIAKVLA